MATRYTSQIILLWLMLISARVHVCVCAQVSVHACNHVAVMPEAQTVR